MFTNLSAVQINRLAQTMRGDGGSKALALGNRLAQIRQTNRRCVSMVFWVANGNCRCLNDVGRRCEVWLAGCIGDNWTACGLQRFRLCVNLEGRRFCDRANTL